MKNRLCILIQAVAFVLLNTTLYAQFQAYVAPEIAERINGNRQLQKGGCLMFDDCAISVGTANFRPGNEMLARSVAHANARAALAGMLNGASVSAMDNINETTSSRNDKSSHKTISTSEITTRIDKIRQNGVRNGGEWLSQDGTTLFLCLYSLVNDTPGKAAADAMLPDFVQEWDVDENWEPLFRSATGILKGGATLVCDDYGEQWLLAVSTSPAKLSLHQRNEMLRVKASATALSYTKGTMLNDMNYLKESLVSEEDSNGNDSEESSITIRHIQSRLTQGNIKGLQNAGTWIIDGGRRVCGAYVLRLSDLSQESFDVQLADTDASDETLELNLEDSQAAELLKQELPKANVSETDKEIILEMPDDSPLFANDENEIVIADNLLTPVPFKEKVTNNVIILPQPQRLPVRMWHPKFSNRIVYKNRTKIVNNYSKRVYMPARHYRRSRVARVHHGHGRPPKPIVLRRGRHHSPPPHMYGPRPRPPKIRIRHPAHRRQMSPHRSGRR